MSAMPGGSGADWTLIRERVEALGTTLRGEARSSASTAAVLEERARALALPRAFSAPGDLLELIEVQIAGERYAIETRFIMEVVAASEIALLPGARAPVVGITAWRGELLPLLDLRSTLGLAVAEPDGPSRQVVLGEDRPAFAIQVDAVLDLHRLPLSSLLPLDAGSRYLRGTTPDALLVLDGSELIGIQG